MSKTDRIVVYLFLVFLVFSPLVFRAASLFTNVSSSGAMKAIVTVNESRGNSYALASLRGRGDRAAMFSYALALKRSGLYEEAIAAYGRILKTHPDAQVYVNLGNAYAGMNNMEKALQSYQAAVNLHPLASAYYNLSGVSRELLDYDKGNEYYRKALEIDRLAVSGYYSVYGRNPNRLVADETISFPALWEVAKENGGTTSAFGLVAFSPWTLTLAALFLIFAFSFLSSRSRNKAYRCKRCNSIFCPRCEKHIMWGQMCPQCYRSLIKLDEMEVRERVARLMSIYEQQKRRRNILKVLSFILPGSSHVFGGKVLFGFLFMWPFLFLLILPAVNAFAASGAVISHWVLNGASLFLAGILYIMANMFTRQRITKGWL
jgi:tetratricopeptide (TPR) repeat protein